MGIYVVSFNSAGVPQSGLTPTFDVFVKVSDGAAVTPPAITALVGGGYKFTYDPTIIGEDIYFEMDGSNTLVNADRYASGIISTGGDVLLGVDDISDFFGLTGPSNVTLTFEEADTTPIMSTWVTIKDEAQTQALWQGTTDANGQVSFTAQGTAGTPVNYKVVANKVGVTYPPTFDLTVAGDTTETYNGTVLVLPTPGSPESVIIYEDFRNPDDTGIPSSINVTAEIIKLPYDFNRTLHKGDKVEATYNNLTGRATWELAKGAKVRFRDGAGGSNFGIDNTVVIPNASARLSDLT